MAKYTELLSEYIENGGVLPAIFNQIQGFEDLFIGEYCDCEIGFETPILFQIKLETKANLIIPTYAKRIAALTAAENDLTNPTKKRVKTGSIEYSGQDTHNIVSADKVRTESDLPFGGENTPEVVTNRVINKGYTDTDTLTKGTKETYNEVTDTESGYTPAEAGALFKALEETVKIILKECLAEFKNLFMVVY